MIRRPPRSTLDRSSAASDVYKRQGSRNEYRFSFQDVVLLRTAHELRAAQVPPRRLLRSLRQLRARLPAAAPPTGLRPPGLGHAVNTGYAVVHGDEHVGALLFDAPGNGGRQAVAIDHAVGHQVVHMAGAQQAQAADVQVAQATQALTQQQAAKPQGKVIQPSVRRYAVQLLEERDLDLWADRADQLLQAQSVATAQAAAAHQALTAKSGARAIAERAQAKLLNANDSGSIPAAQAAITREEAMVAQFDRQALAKEGGQRGKAEADLAAARAELAARLSQQWNEALESLPAANVVDGLALQRRWKASQQRKSPQSPWDTTTIPFGNTTLGFPAPGSNDFTCLLYTSPSPRDRTTSRMPSSA